MKVLACILLVLIGSYQSEIDVSAKKRQTIMMPEWKEVDQILPKYSKFTVLDIETGKNFEVQRRAGSNHADVQPLTSKDTAIMKQIYNGKWSWKRRAILVIKGKKKIAASMHGMPHGAGALQNNFPGHFCIHFYGSTTHRTNFMDLSHKLMILKAAGKLEGYLNVTDPYDLVNAYIAGLKQQDAKIITPITLQSLKWETVLFQIENAKISRMEILPAEDITDELSLTVPIEVSMQLKGIGYKVFRGEIKLIRFMPNEQWKIDSVDFLHKIGLDVQLN